MALLTLSRDSKAINAVVNHPEVRPHVGPAEWGEIDLAPLVEAERNLFPMGEHGGFALIWTAPHTREVHTFILPEGRGRWALDAARDMIRIARDNGTKALWTQVDEKARNVRAYAVTAGMRPTGETLDTFGKPHVVYSMGVPTCQ